MIFFFPWKKIKQWSRLPKEFTASPPFEWGWNLEQHDPIPELTLLWAGGWTIDLPRFVPTWLISWSFEFMAVLQQMLKLVLPQLHNYNYPSNLNMFIFICVYGAKYPDLQHRVGGGEWDSAGFIWQFSQFLPQRTWDMDEMESRFYTKHRLGKC